MSNYPDKRFDIDGPADPLQLPFHLLHRICGVVANLQSDLQRAKATAVLDRLSTGDVPTVDRLIDGTAEAILLDHRLEPKKLSAPSARNHEIHVLLNLARERERVDAAVRLLREIDFAALLGQCDPRVSATRQTLEQAGHLLQQANLRIADMMADAMLAARYLP